MSRNPSDLKEIKALQAKRAELDTAILGQAPKCSREKKKRIAALLAPKDDSKQEQNGSKETTR